MTGWRWESLDKRHDLTALARVFQRPYQALWLKDVRWLHIGGPNYTLEAQGCQLCMGYADQVLRRQNELKPGTLTEPSAHQGGRGMLRAIMLLRTPRPP